MSSLGAATKPARREPSDAALALILAFAAAFFVFAAWGNGLDRPGLYHDEKAYLLQSRIYTDLKFAEPSPPVPELWEQVHVFVTPHYASKYPPGFPALLALGWIVGKPGLIPLLATSATAALLFLFGGKLVGRWTAFVATALWLSAPVNIEWRAAYFAESVTGLLWVAWCYTAWRYRKEGRARDLVITSMLVAFAGITRPVTAIALVIPLPFILWPRLRDLTRWRTTLIALAAGMAICDIVPFWNHGVLDSWTTVPYAEYSARTFPFDMPGWKVNWTPAPRQLPPDIEELAEAQRIPYRLRSIDSVPQTFVSRTDALGGAAVPYKFSSLRYLAPLGLLAAGSAGVVALVSALLLLLAHISMPHPITWTVYYLDVFPVVTFGIVIAGARAWGMIASRVPRIAMLTTHGPLVSTGAGLLLLGAGGTVWRPSSVDSSGWMLREIRFRSAACALPAGPKIIFVRPRPGSSPHHNLVDNDPRWQKSDRWVVRDWGADRDRALMDAAPDRTPYFYDEKAGWIARMGRDGVPTREGVTSVLTVDLNAGRGIECK